MDELLLFRLDLLVNAKEIDEAVRDAVIELVQAVEKRYSLTITEDNGAMLVSHLAMALGRIKRGEELEPIDEDIFAEVKQTQTYRELHGTLPSPGKETADNSAPDRKGFFSAAPLRVSRRR